ncbi:transglutaminase domain-containing protein [Histidinibacterium lentulum]|uniref:Transglutaminase-like domain-containing protein n=1 Tax=Histidinibacterium lentulum TaxID=2480588 RepID=A0A3N2R9I8_9RHOB|nr:transglutaminase domain-containing protein [Histidinibacterium lentulum]ROU04095.1 hypothetical protein EAT49_01470 [Histidinibacterium lentulum]
MTDDTFRCDLSIRFDPWGHADDDELEVLVPLPADDGRQTVRDLRAPEGTDISDAHGHRRMIRLKRGETVEVSARMETRRLRPGDHLDLPPPGPVDRAPGLMTTPDAALRALADESLRGVEGQGARIAALAQAAAGALRYRYPKDARGAALSLARGWGDCGEYAFVFVALCHVAGIPARPVFGMIVAPWFRTPHAWAEAWDGAGWCPVDPNLVREGGYLGPLLETGRAPEAHIGALDPYRVVLSRHTGIPWPGAPSTRSGSVPSITLAVEGLGPVTFWHEAPLWNGSPVVPYLQLPWPMIRHPSRATPLNLLRRQRAWRFRVGAPSRLLPRNPLVWTDLLVLHPLKGLAVVMMAPLVASAVPPLAPALEIVVWAWRLLFPVGMLRYLLLLRLRSAGWLRLEAALGLASPRTGGKFTERTG